MKNSSQKNLKKAQNVHDTPQDKVRKILLDKENRPEGFKTLSDFADVFKRSPSTVSRLFKDMQIKKDAQGFYQLPFEDAAEERAKLLEQMFNDLGVQTWSDTRMIPLRTEKGAAPLAAQRMKNYYQEEVLGALASEDTVLLVVEKESFLEKALERLTPFRPKGAKD